MRGWNFVLALMVAALLATGTGCKPEPAAPAPPAPATTREAPPATQPAATKPAAAKYFDVLRAAYPAFAATQPLETPVAIRESAHIILKDPVHLDEQGHLWITRPDGEPAETETRDVARVADNEHVVREPVLFVWWVPDRKQNYMPRVITAGDGGAAEMIVPSRRWTLGKRPDYQWRRAKSWADGQDYRLIVPTAHGVSIFTYASDREPILEAHHDLLSTPSDTRPASLQRPGTERALAAEATQAAPGSRKAPTEAPLFLYDPIGLIAWVPASPGAPGSNGAARFVRGRWQTLSPDAGWTDRMLHLIPLRDGSVTQLLQNPNGGVKLGLTSVDAPQIDRKVIDNLVEGLADTDSGIRDASFRQLTEYGPGIWPILKEIPADDLPPEARARLNRLLRSQATPMLGGMTLQGDQIRLVSRLRDGGAVFHTEQGVHVANPAGDDPIGHAPAWIAARPGRAVQMLSGVLVYDADPRKVTFDVIQGQWVVTFDDAGPQLFLGNSFRKLLRKDVREYTHIVGIDRRGRWVFRKPADIDKTAGVETLIIDPTLADFTPRLPMWLFANAEEFGWTSDGWPAVQSGESRSKLLAGEWGNLRESDVMHIEPEAAAVAPAVEPWWPVPAVDVRPATSSTQPSTQAVEATTEASTTRPVRRPVSRQRLAELGRILLSDADGNRYFGGIDDLVRVDRTGVEHRWPLPPDAHGDAVGEAPPTLLLAGDKRLFLFNRTGRVLRLKSTPDAAEPFALEATFTQNIPDDERPKRIWLDPAGRIVMAYEKRVAILFPQGYLPVGIRRMMDMDEDDE